MIFHVNSYDSIPSEDLETLVLTCEDEFGNITRIRVRDEFLRSRFYVRSEESEAIRHATAVLGNNVISVKESPVKDRYGRECIEIRTRKKSNVREMRDFFSHTYQADIEWHKMAMIQLGIWEWIEFDPSDIKFGFISISNIRNANDPGWQWKGHTCWIDTEWDSRQLDHFPRIHEAKFIKCDIICYIDDATFDAFIFSTRHDHVELYEKKMIDSRLHEHVNIPEKISVEKRVYSTEKEMIEAFIDHFSRRNFDTISGHNISGGYVIAGDGRRWMNGFDIPMLHERCISLGIDDSPMSPIGRVYERKSQDGKYTVVIPGILQFDWLYAWKFTQYGKEIEKERDGKTIRLHGNGLDELGIFFFNLGKARGMDELRIFYPETPDFDIDSWQVWELHESFPELAEYYCFQDVILSLSLEKMHNVKEDVLSVAYLVGAPPGDAMLASRYHKIYVYRLLKDKMLIDTGQYSMSIYREWDLCNDLFFGTGTNLAGIEGWWTGEIVGNPLKRHGGYVPEAKPGIWEEYIVDLDFKSMYPSSIQSLNGGMDTIVEPSRVVFKNGLYLEDIGGRMWRFDDLSISPAGVFFSQDVESVDSFIYREFAERRAKHKKKLEKYERNTFEYRKANGNQKRIKTCKNSKFGVSPLPVFNTATITGQYLLKIVIEYLGRERVIGGDTDGLHVRIRCPKDEVVEKSMELVNGINEFVDGVMRTHFGCKKNFMRMDIECISDKIIFHMKKMYIERVVWERKWLDSPYYKSRGFKIRRSDSSLVMDDTMMKVINSLFNSSDPRKEVIKIISSIHDRIESSSPVDIGIPRSLTRYIDKYGNTMDARACRFTRYHFGVEYIPSDTFYILPIIHQNEVNGKPVLKKMVSPKPVIAFDDATTHFLSGVKIDTGEVLKQVISAIKPFLEILDIDYFKRTFYGGSIYS